MGDERLVRDVVPAEVHLPDGTRHLRARVFVTTSRLLVFLEGRPPTLAYERDLVDDAPGLASVHASAGTPHRLSTPDGEVFIRRARHTCSCKVPGLMALSWPV